MERLEMEDTRLGGHADLEDRLTWRGKSEVKKRLEEKREYAEWTKSESEEQRRERRHGCRHGSWITELQEDRTAPREDKEG